MRALLQRPGASSTGRSHRTRPQSVNYYPGATLTTTLRCYPQKYLRRYFFQRIRGGGFFNQAGRIASVCRQWRNIALASPRLWACIDTARGGYAKELLARSKSAPLQIIWQTTDHHNMRVAEIVMRQVSRIQTLEIYAHPDHRLRFLHLNRTMSAPMLEVLKIVVGYAGEIYLPPDILHREMSSLRRLVRLGIPSKLLPFPHLTHLELAPDPLKLKSSVFLDVLKHSPKLKEINVDGLFLDHSGRLYVARSASRALANTDRGRDRDPRSLLDFCAPTIPAQYKGRVLQQNPSRRRTRFIASHRYVAFLSPCLALPLENIHQFSLYHFETMYAKLKLVSAGPMILIRFQGLFVESIRLKLSVSSTSTKRLLFINPGM